MFEKSVRYLLGTDQLDNQTVNSAPQRTYSNGLKLDHRNSSDSNRSNYDPPQFGNTQHKGHQERFKPVKSFYIIGIILLYGGLAMALIIPLCYTMNFFETVPCCRKANHYLPFEIFHNLRVSSHYRLPPNRRSALRDSDHCHVTTDPFFDYSLPPVHEVDNGMTPAAYNR